MTLILYLIIIFIFIIAFKFKILTFKKFFVIIILAVLTQSTYNYILYNYHNPKPQEIKFKLLPFPDDDFNAIFDFEKHFIATHYAKDVIYAGAGLEDEDNNILYSYYSVFDTNGNQLLPWQIGDGYVKNGDMFVSKNEKDEIIYYDLKGNLIPNFNNKEIYKFDENNIFMKDPKNKKFYKIDSEGKILEEMHSNFNKYYFYKLENFPYPIINNKIIFESYGEYEKSILHYYDVKTKDFEQLSFAYISNFIQNKAIVRKDNGYFNLVDKDFKEILKNEYAYLKFANNTNYIIGVKVGDDPSILDLNGNEIFSIKCEYLDINDDNIIFYKTRNSEDTLDGILADIKGNILYKINNADDYVMYCGFLILYKDPQGIFPKIFIFDKDSDNLNEIVGDIFYFNRFSKYLKKISNANYFLLSAVMREHFYINFFENLDELIYSIDKKYYKLKLK